MRSCSTGGSPSGSSDTTSADPTKPSAISPRLISLSSTTKCYRCTRLVHRFDSPRQYFRVKEMGRKNPKSGDGKLARMIQREFASIHKRFDETASKQDLAPL